MRALRILALTLVLPPVAAAAAPPQVVVSIEPYFDLVRQVAGPWAEVRRILPPGASPHGFEPSPSDAESLVSADLLVLAGGVDEWLHELVEAAGAAPRVLEALEELSAMLPPEQPGAEGSDDPGEHAHEGVNPHLWLDPVLMSSFALRVGEALAELDPGHAADYRLNAERLAAELRALDAEIAELLAPARGAPFVPFHDAWPHFAERYGLDLLLEIEPFPGREPSPRYLAEAVARIRESGAPAIFSEVGLNDRPARVLAEEAGVELVVLDPLGSDRESYQELMRANAAKVARALAPAGSGP